MWRVNNKPRRPMAVGVIWSLLVAVSAAGSVKAADPEVRLFSGIDEHWVTLQVAVAKDYFAEEGVNVELTTFTTGAAATEAFRSGRGDMISAGDLPSAAMWKTGTVVGVAPMSSDTDIFGIVGKTSINSPADMRGQKVATKVGSTGEFLLYRYLEAGGVDPSEVDIVNLAPPEMVVALIHGDIVAFSWLAPFTTRAIESASDVHLVSSAEGYANNRIILNVTKEMREANPDAVTRVLRAIRKATDFTNENPEEATRIWASAAQGDAERSLPVVELISYDMTFDDAFVGDMDELARFMSEKGALAGGIDWSAEFDASFLKAVDPELVKAAQGN